MPLAGEPFRRMTMKWKSVPRPRLQLVALVGALVIPAVVWAQAQTAQVIAVRAGRVFDPRSGTNVTNQVVLVTGERISDAGPADRVQIPAGARVIDLSQATVLPGLIDGHLHLTDAAGGLQHQMMVALYSATQSLNAGFTTQVVMGSHGGGYADVELCKAIESRLVRGPRLPDVAIIKPMRTSTLLRAEEFARVADVLGSCELVNGEIIPLSPGGFRHSEITARACFLLASHNRLQRLGHVLTGEAGFIVRRGPDTVHDVRRRAR